MRRLFLILPLLLATCLGAGPSFAAETARSVPLAGNRFQLTLSEPVVISLAAPGERRWGRHQFVSLSPYPQGRLLLRFHAGEDSVAAYGSAQPAFLSADQGRTWTAFHEEGLPETGLVFGVPNEQSLCVPMPKPLDVRTLGTALPAPIGEFFCYRKMLLYRAAACPEQVRDFLSRQPARRWDPNQAKWLPDETAWDLHDRLVWIAQGAEASLVSATTFERPPVRVGTELLWADYRATYLLPNGSAPKGCGISCMVSTNQGKSWQRRAAIADADAIPGEISNMTEPALAQTANGHLVCVIRRTDQKQKSMLITSSQDAGRTWAAPRPLDELGSFGVMPALLRLESGPVVLSYGRPGVFLSFSLDGSGKTWESPLCLLPGDTKNTSAKTDGYTSLVALGSSDFLLGYTDFEYRDDQGGQRKAILVRRLSLKRN
jgi:hypothetical protein